MKSQIAKERVTWSFNIKINPKMRRFIENQAFNLGIPMSRLVRKLLCDWGRAQREEPIRKIIKKIEKEEIEEKEMDENSQSYLEDDEGSGI